MVRFPLGPCLAVLSLILQEVFASRTWQAQTSVRLPSGLVVEGHMSKWKPSVVEYLGIRYAEPPVARLRFAPPKPYAGSGKLVASQFVSEESEKTS
jgi:hypothetical protein